MTYKQALEELGNIDSFCLMCCNNCTSNDWYCPSECDVLEKARLLDFDRIVKCYAVHEGNLAKVFRYIKRTKLARKKGGY